MLHGRTGAGLALAAAAALGGSMLVTAPMTATAAPAVSVAKAAAKAKPKPKPLGVTASASTARVIPGQTLTVRGKVKNADATTRVVLQTATYDGWASLGRATKPGKGGAFAITTRPATVGPQSFRVLAVAKGRSVASKAVSTKVYGWTPLTNLERVNSENSYEDRDIDINGVRYPHSWIAGDDGYMEYNVRRDCIAFRGVAGMDDRTQTGKSAEVSVLQDGQLVASADVTTGMSQRLSADITGAFRLTLQMKEPTPDDTNWIGYDAAAIGLPEVLCGFKP